MEEMVGVEKGKMLGFSTRSRVGHITTEVKIGYASAGALSGPSF